MRNRSRESAGLPITNSTSSGGGASSTTTHGSTPKVLLEVMNDEVIPNFRKRVAAGEIFNNWMSSSKSTLEVTDEYSATSTSIEGHPENNSTSNWTNLISYFYNSGSLNLPSMTTTSEESAGRTSASVQCLANINPTGFDAGTFAGEWVKTKRLHWDVCDAIKKLFDGNGKRLNRTRTRTVKRRYPVFDASGNPLLGRNGTPVYRTVREQQIIGGDSVRDALSDLSNLYLVGRYGVGPLLHDLESAAKFLYGRKNHMRETARGTATFQKVSSPAVTLFPDTYGSHTVTAQKSVTWTVRYGVLYEPGLLSGAAKLGLSRPLSTAWELMPWSFVVDWLLDVGSWLDAIQPDLALAKLCAWESTTRTENLIISVFSQLSGMDTHNSFEAVWAGLFDLKTRVKTRGPWSMVPPKFPPLGSGINAIRSLDAATLMLQNVRRRL